MLPQMRGSAARREGRHAWRDTRPSRTSLAARSPGVTAIWTTAASIFVGALSSITGNLTG
jgi:hypothetical protein